MKRSPLPWGLVLLGAVCAAVFLTGDRQSQGRPDDRWRQLPLRAFVQEIERVTSASQPVSDRLWAEIRGQAAERLMATVERSAPGQYGDLVSLYLWSKPRLTPAPATQTVKQRP